MRPEFKESFRQLSLNDKRNQLNNEMEASFRMLQLLKQTMGIPIDTDDTIRNYHMADDADLTESEMLDNIYFDFYTIEKNILDVAHTIIENKK
jgi:hypothetical protein